MDYLYQINFEPVTGCTKISPGCRNCYMVEVSEQLKELGNPRYKNGFNLRYHKSELNKFRAFSKKHKTINRVHFCLNSDLFHKDVPDDFILDTLKTTKSYYAKHNHYILLTKRSDRLLEISKQHPTFFTKNYNVGVSVETPEQYYRIKDLQQVKGCTRWLSLAPFLAPMPDLPLEGIHHVVFTLEEGPGAKQFDDHAIDDVRRQCEAAGTGFRIQPLHRGMEFVKEEGKIGIGSVAMFPEAMIFQLIERTGGLQVIPLWNHPRAADWIKIRKSYHDFTNLEVADVVRKRAPEFFED